jgi:CheY-like chemotaxis protein
VCSHLVCSTLCLFPFQMPICDGFRATSLIRGMANIVQPFICALTANAMEGDAEHCISLGMDHYLSDHTITIHIFDLRVLDKTLASTYAVIYVC